LSDLSYQYATALEAYMDRGGEDCLKLAYELGRKGLSEGLGILDMIGLYQASLRRMDSTQLDAKRMQRIGEFFTESMSPYEMTHRAFGEANGTLRRLNEALEAETQRIARNFHDESGQLLAAVHLQLRELSNDLPANARQQLRSVEITLDQIEHQLRQFSHELRPAVLDDYGLVPALKSFADKFSKRTGLRVRIEGQVEERLSGTVETAVYRIAQEALNNAAKHAKASRVNIRLWRTQREFNCSICDDGIGFTPSAISSEKRSGLGLLGIQERLNGLGGTLQIHSAPEKGAILQISVPLED
jgi:two-component system, NarL family, sensor histidine kinase NreB